MKAKSFVLSTALGLMTVAGVGMTFSTVSNAKGPLVTVSKSPSCGCCSHWVDYLKANGFRVKVNDTHDMRSVKQEAGVPYSLRSCHTATVNGYSVEGHVPAQDIYRLLEESPEVQGIAVAGMPAGSPGMEMGSRKDSFSVVSFASGIPTGEYTQYTETSWW